MSTKKQRPESKKIDRVRSSAATKILILVLLAGIGYQLWSLSSQVGEARAQQEELAAEVAQLEQENTSLSQDIAEGATTEKMKELARNKLDYVDPGEYVFEIIGAP